MLKTPSGVMVMHSPSAASIVTATVSYQLETGVRLLDSVQITLSPGRPCLILGKNDAAYHALGAVLAGLLPLTDAAVPWESVRRLLSPFTGTVHVIEGRLPEPSVYIGPDPDRLLLFSRVGDNFRSRRLDQELSLVALSRFGLGPTFLHRRLAALSGGERMRVALALAFTGEPQALILDGVVPWLDNDGREILCNQINASSSSCVVLLENEWEDLQSVVRQVYCLTDGELASLDIGTLNAGMHLWNGQAVGALPNSEPLLQVSDLRFFDYPDSEVIRSTPVLDSISFAVYPGEYTCIVGPNGAGKSTIAKLIYGLLSPDGGDIQLNGRQVSFLDRQRLSTLVAYLGQYPLQQLPLPTVGSYKEHCDNVQNQAATALIESWVRATDTRPVINLTVIEQKLLAIASGITQFTQLLILDEPTWGLSADEQKALIEYLTSWCKERKDRSILAISHSRRFAEALGGKLMFLNGGRISEADKPSPKTPIVDDVVREKRLRFVLGCTPLWLKAMMLVAVALYCFGFVFIVRERQLGRYCIVLVGITSAILLMLRGAVRRSEFRLLLFTWAVGSLLYAAAAALLVLLGVNLSPYLDLDTMSARWLYSLSYPLRMMAVLATGMLFFEFTSPLEFGRKSAVSWRAALLFRAVEYAKEVFVDTIGALTMLNRWPCVKANRFSLRQGRIMLRRAPELVATVIRNILVWAPWAWMTMSRNVQQHKGGG